MKVGFIFNDEYVEKNLTVGDIYRIEAGSTFFMANTDMDRELRIICSFDPAESFGSVPIQSFFIGGGSYPKSILRGFDKKTLSTALNVTVGELASITESQRDGPIIYMPMGKEGSNPEKLNEGLKNVWTWRKILNTLLDGKEVEIVGENFLRSSTENKVPDAYNIYDSRPDFNNDYGSTFTVDGNHYKPLDTSGIGIYHVNLTAVSSLINIPDYLV